MNDLLTKQKRNQKYRNDLIKTPTHAEIVLKTELEKMKIPFIFQKGFYSGNYHCIVDFYFPKPLKLCVEVDGSIHLTDKQKERDKEKDEYLKGRGFKVLRFTNERVLSSPLHVLSEILILYDFP